VIDLHTHTTASDGRAAPADLVARASAAGVTVLSVTDHDTVAGCSAAAAACETAHIEFVAGIEVTAVLDAADVHILGYYIDRESSELRAFLAEQRLRRIERVRQMIGRLGRHGIRLDADAILKPGLDDSGRAAGRPWIARALVTARYVRTTGEAFDVWLGRGKPAFVPRLAAPPAEVIARIHAAGGLASLAHPGLVRHDDWIPGFAAAGLDALEAYHTEHDKESTERYLSLARRLNLAVTGGSDFHGDESHGAQHPGAVCLPAQHYARLALVHAGLRAAMRATASGADTSS
jgi:predicted metal-dependent phosphoesterase TrpH